VGDSEADLAALLKRAMEEGFRAFLVPLPPIKARNQGQDFIVAVRKRLDALRASGGESIDFVLDGGGSLSPGDASSLSSALEAFHLLWFDEPCRATNLGAIRGLASGNVTPLGFGRQLRDPGAFQDLLREDAVDVLRPALGLNGISQIHALAVLGEVNYVAVAPYHDGGPIGTAAALQLAASLPNFFIQQIPLPPAEEDRRMRSELTGSSVEVIKEGFAVLPTGPGLGISVSEAALEKYQERVI
jgi:galactonate dehydratase